MLKNLNVILSTLIMSSECITQHWRKYISWLIPKVLVMIILPSRDSPHHNHLFIWFSSFVILSVVYVCFCVRIKFVFFSCNIVYKERKYDFIKVTAAMCHDLEHKNRALGLWPDLKCRGKCQGEVISTISWHQHFDGKLKSRTWRFWKKFKFWEDFKPN